MAKFFYYANNIKVGPFEKDVLQQLSETGVIQCNTIIEADTGHRCEAGKISWLKINIMTETIPVPEQKNNCSVPNVQQPPKRALIYLLLGILIFLSGGLLTILVSNFSESMANVTFVLSSITAAGFVIYSFVRLFQRIIYMMFHEGRTAPEFWGGVVFFAAIPLLLLFVVFRAGAFGILFFLGIFAVVIGLIVFIIYSLVTVMKNQKTMIENNKKKD